jgi:hypothetical protein
MSLAQVEENNKRGRNCHHKQRHRRNRPELTIVTTIQQRPHTYNNQPYLPNGAAGGHTGLPPGAAPLLPNNGRIVQTGGVRVLCIADVRGGSQSENFTTLIEILTDPKAT